MAVGTANQDANIDPTLILPNIQERLHQLEDALTAIGFDSKASKKRRFPSKRQESVLQGITRALCIETIDPWKENRIRFYHPLLHKPDTKLTSLPFASPVSSMGGFDDSGLNWVPPAGSTVMVFFEGGSRDAPFYIGTTWHRDRGAGGQQLNSVFISREWNSIYANTRAGNFLHGPDDGSQVLPPWNTESYNASDITQIQQFSEDPQEQRRITYPNIYGFKTPEKHMLKMVDGDAKCNRRWKRLELASGGGGGWMIFKDDHLHYGGQWAHPDCPPSNPSGSSDNTDDTSICAIQNGDQPYFTDIQGQPIEKDDLCGDCTTTTGPCSNMMQCGSITGGHSSTPCDPMTKYCNVNKGANRFFKQRNECRPYKGPGTPQNNRCDLPQSGIQFLSRSGHTFVMDDSVEEPRYKPDWKMSLMDFDFGCNDKYLGRLYIKHATGHEIMMSGTETEQSWIRDNTNMIRLKSASGNRIELNDHTVPVVKCQGCAPNYAGESRGITMETTSSHTIKMIDHLNPQCSPVRSDGGIPMNDAHKGYIQIRSGYGLEMRFNDDFSQQETQTQYIQIMHPQCSEQNIRTDPCCQSGDCPKMGPHFLRMQANACNLGLVFLRAGGMSVRQTYDQDIVIVGSECNPADKFTFVSKKHIRVTEDLDYRYSGELHIFFAEKQILLMAGRDCPTTDGDVTKQCAGPCLYSVIVARCPVYCPLTGILHWTEKAMSERVFASAWKPCGVPCNS